MAELLTTDQTRPPVFATSVWGVVLSSREIQFWVLQFAGWLGISLISYVSLNLWYNQPQLKEGLNLANPAACLLVDPPAAPHRRVSLTLSKLLQAREIIVHITGEEKVSVIENAWRVADPERFPISAVLHQSLVPVTIFSDRAIALG